MVKWTEVSAYSGMPVKEDAPTNATGAAVAGTGDDSSVVVVRKKKKKTFLDARTKEYKAHQKRLEAARQRREERKRKAAEMNEKVEYVEYKFKNKNDAMKVKKMLDGMQLMKFDINDDNINNGELIVDAGNRDMTKVHSNIMTRYKPKVMTQEEQIDEALSPQDKKVIDAFYFTDKPMTGKILKTDGKTLEKTGMGAQTIAKVIPQSGGEFKVVAKMDGRSTQEIVNYIKKTFPKQLVKYEGTQKTFSQKVQEQIGGFAREAFLAENNMDVIKSIVKSKGAKDIKMKDGKLKMDAFTASAIAQVYDKVNPTNKKKMEDLANGRKADLMKLQALAMKFVK